MIASVLIMSGSRTAFIVMLVAFCMNLAAIISRLHEPSAIDLYLLAGAWLIIAITLGWVVARAVFAPGRVTYHRIIGAVLPYLLIALVFVALFIFAGLASPQSFSGLALQDSPSLAANLIYFSFATLTTTGYGDIIPVHPLARSLCNLEAIIGQLYPATLLARLVSLEIEGRRRGDPCRRQVDNQFRLRSRSQRTIRCSRAPFFTRHAGMGLCRRGNRNTGAISNERFGNIRNRLCVYLRRNPCRSRIAGS